MAGLLGALFVLAPTPAFAMHISEGILPAGWAIFWWAVIIPFLYAGIRQVKQRRLREPSYPPRLGLFGAAVFIISCMPVPVPVAGSCSHPCGTGLAAIFIGPLATVLVSFVALLIQALFLAHGGLSTLGGNTFSMGIVGGFTGYCTYQLLKKRLPLPLAALAAGLLSDWATYATTSLELSLALGSPGGRGQLFLVILAAFVPTQLPLGIFEGLMSMFAVKWFLKRRPDLLRAGAVAASCGMALWLCLAPAPAAAAAWQGVDETVVESYANQHGRPASDPLINTDQGDLLLFFFLLAGAAGGFVMGYSYRKLMEKGPKPDAPV